MTLLVALLVRGVPSEAGRLPVLSVHHSCFQPAVVAAAAAAAVSSHACKLRVLDQSRCTVVQLSGTDQLGELTPST